MASDLWLVRTATNRLTGPMSKDQVIRFVLEGKIGLQDEICFGNGYWFYLHEASELKEQLGIEVPPRSVEGGTLTVLDLEGEKTDPDFDPKIKPQAVMSVPASQPVSQAETGLPEVVKHSKTDYPVLIVALVILIGLSFVITLLLSRIF